MKKGPPRLVYRSTAMFRELFQYPLAKSWTQFTPRNPDPFGCAFSRRMGAVDEHAGGKQNAGVSET